MSLNDQDFDKALHGQLKSPFANKKLFNLDWSRG